MMTMINGPLRLITGTKDGNMSVLEARWGAAAFSLGAAILASKMARDRASKGQEPIAGLLF